MKQSSLSPEAFVYCWTDKKTNMLYVGSHRGSTEDGYICSSKYMLEEYNKRPQDFSRQIVASGALSDMRTFETKLLQAFNVKEDESFYNRHQNDGLYFDGWKTGEMTSEHRKKLSEAKIGKPISEEHKTKLHEGRRNSKNSDAHKKALIESRKGSKHSEESKRKMSEKKRSNPERFEISRKAGIESAKKRPADYNKRQSERIKLWWAERKKNKGEQH
jgi:hypothetical protein